jgi:hypothetical protein
MIARFLTFAKSGLFLVLLFSVCIRAHAAPSADQRIAEEGQPFRLPLPDGWTGDWTLTDDRGEQVREGSIPQGDRSVTFADLKQGIYYLFPGGVHRATALAWTGKRLSFLVVPHSGRIPEDHFFAVNQPEMTRMAAGTDRKDPASPYCFTLDAMQRTGIHRLRTALPWPDAEPKQGTFDWKTFDALDQDISRAGVRLIATLGGTPAWAAVKPPVNDPRFSDPKTRLALPAADPKNAAEYVNALLRQYGFKLDEFAAWDRPYGPRYAGTPASYSLRLQSVYTAIKTRLPYSGIAFGGVGAEPLRDRTFVRTLIDTASTSYDVLDLSVEGDYRAMKDLVRDLDAAIAETPAAERPRAVAYASIVPESETLAEQHRVARELLKESVYAHYREYRYFAYAAMVDPVREDAGPVGFFSSIDRCPRASIAAWLESLLRIGKTKPIARLGFEGDNVTTYAFDRNGESVVLVAWVPLRDNDLRSDKRVAITLYWPDEADARVLDMMGRDITAKNLRSVKSGEYHIMVDVDPIYIVVDTPMADVGW